VRGKGIRKDNLDSKFQTKLNISLNLLNFNISHMKKGPSFTTRSVRECVKVNIIQYNSINIYKSWLS